MLSRDAIKTRESLRYSGYSDSNSACISLGIKKTHTKKKRKSRAQKNTKHKTQNTHKKKNKKKLSLSSLVVTTLTRPKDKKSGERSVFCVCEEQRKESGLLCVLANAPPTTWRCRPTGGPRNHRSIRTRTAACASTRPRRKPSRISRTCSSGTETANTRGCSSRRKTGERVRLESFLLLLLLLLRLLSIFVSKFIIGILESRRAITVGLDDDDDFARFETLLEERRLSNARGRLLSVEEESLPLFFSLLNKNGRVVVMSWS